MRKEMLRVLCLCVGCAVLVGCATVFDPAPDPGAVAGVRLRVFDADTGVPLAGQAFVGRGLPAFGADFATLEIGGSGEVFVPVADGEQVVVYASGHVPELLAPEWLGARVRDGEVLHLAMTSGSTLTGVVRDARGQPVEGAEVVVSSPVRTQLHGEEALVYPGYAAAHAALACKELVETDAEGRYRVRGLAPSSMQEVRVSLVGLDLPATRRVPLEAGLVVDLVTP